MYSYEFKILRSMR